MQNTANDATDAIPIAAHCDETKLYVALSNGETIMSPLWWYPTILNAPLALRNEITLSPMGLHWLKIDEDISIDAIREQRRTAGAKPQ